MIILLQIILWVLLIYVTSKVVNPLTDKIINPFQSISNMLFNRGIDGVANEIISYLIIIFLFLLNYLTVIFYLIVSFALIDFAFLKFFGV